MILTENLQQDAQTARSKNVPMLVVFSQAHCAFCVTLDQEIIQPMLISGDYTDKVLIREIMIDRTGTVVDFDGNAVSPREVFDRYGLFVTPTILLLDHNGKEIAERMTGINTVEYYGYYLDQSIQQALMQVRQKTEKVTG